MALLLSGVTCQAEGGLGKFGLGGAGGAADLGIISPLTGGGGRGLTVPPNAVLPLVCWTDESSA